MHNDQNGISILLQIIHLIRDPRGLVNSRRKVDGEFKERNAIDFCRKQLLNGRTGDTGPKWIRQRYLRVWLVL